MTLEIRLYLKSGDVLTLDVWRYRELGWSLLGDVWHQELLIGGRVVR